MYQFTENELYIYIRSRLSKVRALQTDRQTDRQTNRQIKVKTFTTPHSRMIY